MTADSLYQKFNAGLLGLREAFHRTGRLDDSNAKLDEIVKILAIEISLLHAPDDFPSLASLLEDYRTGKKRSLIAELNRILGVVSRSALFRDSAGEPLLGKNPSFGLQSSDEAIAEQMVQLIVDTFNGTEIANGTTSSFEILNEAFGHFVRDNFRNNVEDAQYMTPPEVVAYICGIALEELRKSAGRNELGDLVVADPSCGVGSFLAHFCLQYRQTPLADQRPLRLLGQDKVDRMARLAKLNLLLFRNVEAQIFRGNSLMGPSPLDRFNGSCDIVLTNPPFGARFLPDNLLGDTSKYHLLSDVIQTSNVPLDSEYLFIDRYFTLLKPGGTLLAVVPDATVSASGLAQLLRTRIENHFSIRSLTELPAVTFGQAGTRTRTCVLHLQKNPTVQRRVFVAIASEIGFEVASRKGVPVKRISGKNDLAVLLKSYARFAALADKIPEDGILTENPSSVAAPLARLQSEEWTPSHHSATRYRILTKLAAGGAEYEVLSLRDLVVPPIKPARGAPPAPARPVRSQYEIKLEETDEGWRDPKCISVLHVSDYGALNLRELMSYAPLYPGQPCSPGDVLFSKINPRIPRAVVVPNLPVALSCSREFEVLRPKPNISPYALAMLLLSEVVQNQVTALTSGTSSSHNRIKSEQLLSVRFPWPKAGTRAHDELLCLAENYRSAQVSLHQASYDAFRIIKGLDHLISVQTSPQHAGAILE